MLNVDHSRSYATRENLETALRKRGLDKFKSLTVRNTEGNWTAIFLRSFLKESDGEVMHIAHQGFMVIG